MLNCIPWKTNDQGEIILKKAVNRRLTPIHADKSKAFGYEEFKQKGESIYL